MARAAAYAVAVLFLLTVSAVAAETLRIASFHTELSQKGPGLLLRALERDADPDLRAVLETIAEAEADVIVLQGVDWDYRQLALDALQERLQERGADYPHVFTARPNAGVPSGVDLDGDGRTDGPGDSLGWGRFTGQGGMAVLSRFPIAADKIVDLTPLLWRDLPDQNMPYWPDGTPFPTSAAQEIWPLSSVNHWALPIVLPGGPPLWLLCFHAAPPVFDGKEDRNGRRNADEIHLWRHVIERRVPTPVSAPFVIAGVANLDPAQGEGRKEAIHGLLNHPQIQDPQPKDDAGQDHTVIWKNVGRMRVDYVLPSSDLRVQGTGILRANSSRHDLVWVDLRWPPAP